MNYQDYKVLKFRVEKGVLFVTIDNPPINLLTMELAGELLRLSEEVGTDEGVRVIVFDSANPDFFIAHFDVGFLTQFPDVPVPSPLTFMYPTRHMRPSAECPR